MAILKFYMDQENNDQKEMKVKILMHKGEKETDKTYLWAKYALGLSIQLNFNKVDFNPFTEDTGCSIHFLSKNIFENNDLNEYGIGEADYSDYQEFYGDETLYEVNRYFMDDKDKDNFLFTDSNSSHDIEETTEILLHDENYVNILLNQYENCLRVGGLLTMTATSATAIHEALKEASKRLKNNK